MDLKERLVADGGPRSEHGPAGRRWRDPGAAAFGEPGELAYRPAVSGECLGAPAVDWLDFNTCVRAVAADLDGAGLSLDEDYAQLPCLYLQEDELQRVATALLGEARARVARAGRRDGCIRIETRSEGGHVVLMVSHNGVGERRAPAGSGPDPGTATRVLFPLDVMEASQPASAI